MSRDCQVTGWGRLVPAFCSIQKPETSRPRPVLWLALAVSLSLVVPALAKAIDFAVVFPAEDTNAVLHNPDMGWVLYENYPLDPDPHGSSTLLTLPGDDFPEADAVALMFSWQDVETREGVYDFSKVDAAYDYWQKRGKALQLRLSTESLMYWAHRTPPTGKGVPDYVLAHLGATERQTRTMDGAAYEVVDARNAFYRKRLAAFLRAVAQHFDARRPVALIDLRGFGAWGEWHSGFRYPDPQARRTALTSVLDVWSAAFPHNVLALSCSYDPDSPKAFYAGPYDHLDPAFTTNHNEFLNFSAFDYALTKTNITFRRDGCGGAVHSNERQLNEAAFRTCHRAPMMSEFLGGYGAVKKGGTNWVNWMVEDALSLHPNYVNLLGWQGADARDFARERPDLIARGLRVMGYRLVPTRVSYPQSVTNGQAFEVDFDWVNRGVGRALRDYELQFLLVSRSGEEAASVPVSLPTSQWLAATTYTVRAVARFPDLPPGDYVLAFTLRDPASLRAIALPLRELGSRPIHRLGPIHLGPARAASRAACPLHPTGREFSGETPSLRLLI